MKKFPWGTLIALAVTVCIFGARSQTLPPPEKAAATMRAMGFDDVTVRERHAYFVSFQGCGWHDSVAYHATAKDRRGEPVRLVACCDWLFTGCYVRGE